MLRITNLPQGACIHLYAKICFLCVCISGLCIGSGTDTEPTLTSIIISLSQMSFLSSLFLIPFIFREIIKNIRFIWFLWLCALIPIIHPSSYNSLDSVTHADGILLISVCGIILGHVLSLKEILSTFFLSLVSVLIYAICYTILYPEFSFSFVKGLHLWKSFLPSANSIAVIIGSIALLYDIRWNSSSQSNRLLLFTFLITCIILTRNISIVIALLAVDVFNNRDRYRSKRTSFIIIISLIGGGLFNIYSSEISRLFLLHGRISQWNYYLHHFNSFWFGLGAGNIQLEHYVIEFQKRFLDIHRTFNGNIAIYIDNGYLNLFFDYGILGLLLFLFLIRKILISLDSTKESTLLLSFLLYLAIMNITGGWLLYPFSPWWLLLMSTATNLCIHKLHLDEKKNVL